MTDLDRPDDFAAVDASDALADLEAMPQQWARARGLLDSPLDLSDVDAVVVTGMGGSGVAGDVAAALAADRLAVPVMVQKGFGLPKFVGPRTQVVAVSYSGDTEETRSGVEQARDAGARVLAITSGGALAARATKDDFARVLVPGGGQPRHSLGYLAAPVLVALGLDEGLDEALSVLDHVVGRCRRDVPTQDNPAKRAAACLAEATVPVLWGVQGLAALAARRLRNQLAENAKMCAMAAELPELGHNEVVGWQEPVDLRTALVWLRDPVGEHPRNQVRVGLSDSLVAERFAWTGELRAEGVSPLARCASLMLLADFASVYTAIALGRDPTPIPFINRLKEGLAAAH